MMDRPGVVAPPPLIFLSFLALALALDRLFPFPTGWPLATRQGLAALLGGAALMLLIGAVTRFRRAGTDVRPWKPSTAIVSEGVYRITRNPMYVGMALIYLSLGLLADSWMPLFLLPGLILAVNHGVIYREERYLERKFGEPYLAYKSQAPRWLFL